MPLLYRKILLKLSGETLGGTQGSGLDWNTMLWVSKEIHAIHTQGIQIAIVIGGGNIVRGIGAVASGVSRIAGDSAGMLATAINCLFMAEALQSSGCRAQVLSAVAMEPLIQVYSPQRAKTLMENNTIVLIACGTGNPFFTTDTAAALRCAETQCDVLLKATKVDGIYDSDPMKNPHASKILKLSHKDALKKNIEVMDAAAFSVCMDNEIPIRVFKLLEAGNLLKCISEHTIGSTVTKGD